MIKVIIYEDNPQLREGLTLLINGTDGFEVLSAYKNCDEIEAQVEVWKPDVILMDIDMPGTNGIDGLKRLRKLNDEVKVLMLTVFDDNKNVFEAVKSGANGYLLKKTPPSKLLDYIQEAHTGGAPMTASVASQVLNMFAHMHKDHKNEEYDLSEREKEVLQFLVKGFSYKMIASDMYISIDTVRSHIKKIYEKLHVNSKSEAVAKAFKDRLV
jgi:DNA-binding NarL/FixJ family response regulator